MTSIVLYGEHGGELDRINLKERDATTEAVSRAVSSLATRCTLHVGDTIKIESTED